ncbi:tyrosine-type recombinase/integrase [uncultured Psychrobacter sp.]|uniref:tyrosine-type recombinase/integrase n=1 Tax=uncultured Psychrobacter sp. TaxID=259303 RepID=UPI002595483F|nr:tyrosine-type recombinase/integrase [uncultured Psychrobacter sp.]
MQDSFYEIILPSTPTRSNPKNVFKDNATQFRNFLIARLLINYGLRASELLLLSLKSIKPNVNSSSKSLVICDTQDTKDYRSPKPNIKNEQSNRTLQLSRDDDKLISYYVNNYRSKNAKSDLLFLSSQYPFSPLSYSSINKMFNVLDKQFKKLYPDYYDSKYTDSIDKLSAHTCRHTWATLTLKYAYITAVNNLSSQEAAMSQAVESLKKAGGWSSNSLMVSRYADRYLSARANTINISRIINHGNVV